MAAADLVVGDIVWLEAGAKVPADLRLVESAALRIDEAALTGESVPVDKDALLTCPDDSALADRRNMAYAGTNTTGGRALGLVVGTGRATQLGTIARLVEQAGETRTPLQERLARFGRRLALAVLAICAVIFAAGVARGEPAALMFLTAVSLAVAAIPEALPAVVSIALAFGARRMSRENALVRRLPCVESLGSVTVICSDKTGTLTQNRLRLERFEAASEETRDHALEVLALNNDASRDSDGGWLGDPTEIALVDHAHASGVDIEALRETLPRIAELPFDSERKRMTTVHERGKDVLVTVKGAPEAVLPLCAGIDAGPWHRRAEAMAAGGLRVLAIAARSADRHLPIEDVDRELHLLGLVGLIDPPRPEARAAVAECLSAGIAPVMITGDHPSTALAIARALGIADEAGDVITGSELERLDDASLGERLRDVRVFARVDPAQKIRIVEALQAGGAVVAMTGDGVNDAPALKKSDIGVSMGRGGTDVAREASDLVLLDDNFATIVAAVREGRRIYDNIRKFVRFVMAGNAGEIWTIFLAPFLGLPIPLTPIQILWVNFITDGLPGLALASEPAEVNVMRRPPRPRGESVFAHGIWQHILWAGLLIGGVSLAACAWAIGHGEHPQTMAFTVLTFAQLVHVEAIRSETQSLCAHRARVEPLHARHGRGQRRAAPGDRLRAGPPDRVRNRGAFAAGAGPVPPRCRRSCSSASKSRSGPRGKDGSTTWAWRMPAQPDPVECRSGFASAGARRRRDPPRTGAAQDDLCRVRKPPAPTSVSGSSPARRPCWWRARRTTRASPGQGARVARHRLPPAGAAPP